MVRLWHWQWIVIVAVVTTVTGNIVRGPEHTEAVSGSTVTLRCRTDSANRANPIEWHFKAVGNALFKIIYKHRKVVNVVKGKVKIVDDPDTGSYDLVISDVALSDAGAYFCMDDDSQRTADLVVFDRYPSAEFCFVNKSADELLGINRCLNDSDTIRISCRLRFRGKADVHLEWQNGERPIESSSFLNAADGTTTTTIQLKADDLQQSSNFSCLVKYKNDKITSNLHWTTAIDVIKITDSPVVTSGDCGLRGRNCSAVGPTTGGHRWEYVWTDDSDNVVARGSYLEVVGLPRGNYSCVVTRVFGEAACSYVVETLEYNCDETREETTTLRTTTAVSDASATSVPAMEPPLLVIMISVVTVAAVTLTLVVVTILILKRRLRRKDPNNSDERKTLNTEHA